VKFLCDQCKAKYQIADDKVAGKTVRMKCRKCGHLIEVRAAVTETSVATESVPPAALPPPKGPPGRLPPGAAPRPPLATGLAAAKPAQKPAPGSSALAGAFKSNVAREDEVSRPFDMAELGPDDAWYVAINGVPVGPIKISEVRRKAALGAVTEDSLVWQEGQDEWRPARQLADLAAIIREAATSGRTSLTPPPGGMRASTPPPRSTSLTPKPAGGIAPKAPLRPPGATSPAAARSNVVPITSRLATAEKLDESAAPARISVAPDPFALPPASASAAIAPPGATSPLLASGVPAVPQEFVYRKQPPWIVIGMLIMFGAFGVTAAIVVLRPNPPAPVVVQMPAAAPAAPTQAAPTATPTAGPTDSAATAAPTPTKVAVATGPRPASAAPSPAGRSLDLHSLAQNSNVGPGEDPGSEGPKAPGQCFSSGQVQQVIGMHQLAIRRACWERDPTTKPTVNVTVSMTIGSDGSPQGVSASGDEASVAKCIENDVRGWHFPAMGCSQKTGFSFKFVRQ
jgi:predicted Zn finger-like uncharacterized protein